MHRSIHRYLNFTAYLVAILLPPPSKAFLPPTFTIERHVSFPRSSPPTFSQLSLKKEKPARQPGKQENIAEYDKIATELHNLSKQIHLRRKQSRSTYNQNDRNRKYNNQLNEQVGSIQPYARKLCQRIVASCESHNEGNATAAPLSYISYVGPTNLLQTLLSLATLDLKCQITLLKLIGNRLKEGDALGAFSGHDLSMAIWAYAKLSRPHLGVLKSFMRRLRKKKVRKAMSPSSICRSVWGVARSMDQLDLIIQRYEYGLDHDQSAYNYSVAPGDSFDDDCALLRHESETMCFTLLSELREPVNFTVSTPTMASMNAIAPQTRIAFLRAQQVADILCSCVVFEMNKEEKVILDVCDHLAQEKLMNQCNAKDISRILWSLQRLQLYDQTDLISLLQRRFIGLLGMYGPNVCDPKTLNTILRSLVMMLPSSMEHSPDTMALFQGVDILLLSDKRFLSRCNEFEISNICWAIAKAKYYKKETLQLISERMLDRDILATCSPSSASRILWSMTTLNEQASSLEDVDEGMQDLLFEMFSSLGGIMLSSKLAPVDCAHALWSMAKSSYALDMNVFDHLAKVLACDFMLERATVQQVVIALWSCGKMYSWEDTAKEKIEYGSVTTPSYVFSARAYATFLVSFSGRLSPKDVAQSIWALGRLKITDESIIKPLSLLASQMVADGSFNPQEVANILWGLSKVGFKNTSTITPFLEEIKTSSIMDRCSSQEAANILYALGRMKIRDQEAFNVLNSVLMKHLHQATPQAMANVLWAHECVGLQPPMELFNRWTKEKLNITGLYLNKTNDIKINVIED